ncbi:MAG: hypothetical protein AAGI48_11570 [Verrucomicrobiota bacterium]
MSSFPIAITGGFCQGPRPMADFHRMAMLAGLSILIASCGNEGGDVVDTPPVQEGFQQRSGEMGDDDWDKIADRFGGDNPRMRNGQFEGADEASVGGNQYFQGEMAKREFAAKDYRNKAFWGSKDYQQKVYGGPTDGSRFQKGSRLNGKGAREGSLASTATGAAYSTGSYATGGAREEGQAGIGRSSDPKVDARRRSFKEPPITDWRNQRGLTIDDTRSMLGRGE